MDDEGWAGVEPGDIGFDQGGGFVGFLIRTFTHSPYAHCWVFHGDERTQWLTVEAYPGGLRMRVREKDQVHRVARVWRTEEERQAILARSNELVGSGYNYRELLRIVHYRVRKSFVWFLGALFLAAVLQWDALAMSLLALLAYGAIPLRSRLDPKRVICSNHVAQCVMNARPDVRLSFAPQAIWPGRLERDLNLVTWRDWQADLQERVS